MSDTQKPTTLIIERITVHKHTSAFVNMDAPASFAAASIANDTEPIPPSTYLHVTAAVKLLFYLLREDMIKSPSLSKEGNSGFEIKQHHIKYFECAS